MSGLLMQAQQIIAPSFGFLHLRIWMKPRQFGTRKNSKCGKQGKGNVVVTEIFCQAPKIGMLPFRINNKKCKQINIQIPANLDGPVVILQGGVIL
jgi:hypothetical protein